MQGDIKDFYTYLDNNIEDNNITIVILLRKPTTWPPWMYTKESSAITMDLNISKDPRAQKELFILFGLMFQSMEDRFTNRLDESKAEILTRDVKIVELQKSVWT